MSWIRKTYKNLLALGIGFFAALIVLEILLRIYNPFEFRVRGDKIILPANVKYRIKNSDKSKFDKLIIHTKNSIGFRGSEPPKNFDDYMTIIAIGGSTTECLYLSDGKDWPNVLGRKLKNNINNVWVNNAGLDGHSTFGHIVLMEDYITKRYKPKMVLFLIGANEGGRKDLSPYDRDKMLSTGVNFESIKDFSKSVANYSEVLNSVINIYRYIMATRIMDLGHNQIDPLALKTLEMSEEKERSTIEEHTREFIPYYKKRVKRLVELAKNNGIEPCLITQPALYGNAIDDVTGVDLAKTNYGRMRWNLLQLYNAAIKEVAREENVLAIDLANEMPKSSKYYYDYYHYTNEGAERVAEIIYRHLYPHVQEKFKQCCN